MADRPQRIRSSQLGQDPELSWEKTFIKNPKSKGVINMMKLTRRYFLQGIGASAVLGTLTGLAPTKALAMNSYGANTSLLAKRAGTIKYSSCLRNCADRCLMKFSVQNGRMTYVRGADEQYKTGSCPCVMTWNPFAPSEIEGAK